MVHNLTRLTKGGCTMSCLICVMLARVRRDGGRFRRPISPFLCLQGRSSGQVGGGCQPDVPLQVTAGRHELLLLVRRPEQGSRRQPRRHGCPDGPSADAAGLQLQERGLACPAAPRHDGGGDRRAAARLLGHAAGRSSHGATRGCRNWSPPGSGSSAKGRSRRPSACSTTRAPCSTTGAAITST